MDKKFYVLLGAGILLLPSQSWSAQPSKSTHLVQEHIAQLDTKLKNTNLNYDDRRKLEAHLRRYFDNTMYGKHREVKNLSNPEVQRVADSIKKSYEDILRTPGDHKNAAKSFANQATGLIALHVNPEGYRMKNKAVKVRRAQEARTRKAKKSASKSRMVEPLQGPGTSAAAGSATAPSSLSSPTASKTAAQKMAVKKTGTKKNVADHEKKAAKKKRMARKEHKATPVKKETVAEKKARKLRKKRMRAQATQVTGLK